MQSWIARLAAARLKMWLDRASTLNLAETEATCMLSRNASVLSSLQGEMVMASLQARKWLSCVASTSWLPTSVSLLSRHVLYSLTRHSNNINGPIFRSNFQSRGSRSHQSFEDGIDRQRCWVIFWPQQSGNDSRSLDKEIGLVRPLVVIVRISQHPIVRKKIQHLAFYDRNSVSAGKPDQPQTCPHARGHKSWPSSVFDSVHWVWLLEIGRGIVESRLMVERPLITWSKA